MKGNQTRAKFVKTATQLFQAHGYHGVGLKKIIAESGGPKGSFYFHFNGGKADLALASIAKSREDVESLLSFAAKQAPTADAYFRAISKGLKRWLRESDFKAGCPIAGFTIELAASEPRIADCCRDAYSAWIKRISEALVQLGLEDKSARSLAGSVIASFEGGVVVCRAMRSVCPLDQIVTTLGLACGVQRSSLR